MATANEMKLGNVIAHNGERYKVVKTEHVKPGKGGAFIQAELKNIKTGAKLNERFRSDETIEKVFFETQKATFLYDTGSEVEVMYTENYEQTSIPYDAIGEARIFLTEGMEITVELADGDVISANLPIKVKSKIAETESYIKGQTISNSFKPAILENGFRISVPQFIEQGEEVYVNTETLEYMERVK